MNFWSWLLGIRWKVRIDDEKVDRSKSYIIVSNHQVNEH